MYTKKTTIFRMMYFAFLLSIAACSYQNVKVEPTDNLEATVKTYYDLKKEGKNYEAWNFERMSTYEDEKLRETAKNNVLTHGNKMQIKGYEIIEIGKEGSAIEGLTPVNMKITSTWPQMTGFKFPEGDNIIEIEDLWQKINGKWYHVVRGMEKNW
ncbi:MAG: hypothetical protein HQL03_03520 [Nitrospirae bacterium]|nr:hypothetical protein [Nitrospirota bacterium]